MEKQTHLDLDHIVHNGRKVPLNIIVEWRKDVRASIGTKSINIRLPKFLSKKEKRKEVANMLEWVNEQLATKPELLQGPKLKEYHDGQELKIGDTLFTLNIKYFDRSGSRAKRVGNTLHLELDDRLSLEGKNRHIKQLSSRLIAEAFYPLIWQRLRELNVEHFQADIKGLKLKRNETNWGSCSWDGNINISTRLFFAPKATQDYVLIHELAHLVHHNHSKAFWQLVAKACPDYKKHEEWLKKNGHLCDF